jgi:ABC-2 type transport system ATP-binding protein
LTVTNHPPPAADFYDVSKRRGGVKVLEGFNLTFAQGEVTALLGPNGAGKSTIVGLTTGQLSPDRGRVRLMGADPRLAPSRARLGVMLQEAGSPRALTVREQIDLFRGYYGKPRSRAEVVALAGLQGLERRRCSDLSGGQQRRLQFALAICGRPDFLVMDEPTTGMDLEARRSVWTAVRAEAARGASVLLTTHYLEEAEALADRVVVLERGRVIADGPPQSIKAEAASGVVRCRTRLTDAELQALPGVISVTHEGGRVVVLTREPQATVRDLLARDPGLEELSLTGASLEDAFHRLLSGAAQPQSNQPELEPTR